MDKKLLFDDTETSGWCVMDTHQKTVNPALVVHAAHVTCTRTNILEYEPQDDGDYERWSWFMDDTTVKGAHVCFECGEPVPEHIQALVVLAGGAIVGERESRQAC